MASHSIRTDLKDLKAIFSRIGGSMKNLFPTDFRYLPKPTNYRFLDNYVVSPEPEKLFLGIFWMISDRGNFLKFFLQTLKIHQIAYLTIYISLYNVNGVLLRY